MSESNKEKAKPILQSNFNIVYNQLNLAIDNYLGGGYTRGEFQNMEAYLAATIHAIMDYAERFLENNEDVNSCRYVNNTLKHSEGYITHKQVTGGISFPVTFPFVSEKIRVVWKYDETLNVNFERQKIAFKKHWAGKDILSTLEPLANMIIEGVETK